MSVATLPSRGQTPLTWQFDYTDFVVYPIHQIIVPATITNTSDAPFRISGASKSFAGDLQKTYHWEWGKDLYDVTVPAHGTFQFLFGTLTPIGGSAPVGVYDADPAFISFGEGWQSSENTFKITVIIPEPTTLTLLGLGTLGLMLARRRWRKLAGFRVAWIRIGNWPRRRHTVIASCSDCLKPFLPSWCKSG